MLKSGVNGTHERHGSSGRCPRWRKRSRPIARRYRKRTRILTGATTQRIVVGGGLAGVFVAKKICENGSRVVFLDKSFFRETIRTNTALIQRARNTVIWTSNWRPSPVIATCFNSHGPRVGCGTVRTAVQASQFCVRTVWRWLHDARSHRVPLIAVSLWRRRLVGKSCG